MTLFRVVYLGEIICLYNIVDENVSFKTYRALGTTSSAPAPARRSNNDSPKARWAATARMPTRSMVGLQTGGQELRAEHLEVFVNLEDFCFGMQVVDAEGGVLDVLELLEGVHTPKRLDAGVRPPFIAPSRVVPILWGLR